MSGSPLPVPPAATRQHSLGPVLQKVAEELAALSETSLSLQDVVTDLLACSQRPDYAMMKEFQALDRMSQVLRDLSLLSRLIGEHATSVQVDDHIIARLTLHELRSMLAGGVGADNADGDVDLF